MILAYFKLDFNVIILSSREGDICPIVTHCPMASADAGLTEKIGCAPLPKGPPYALRLADENESRNPRVTCQEICLEDGILKIYFSDPDPGGTFFT